jgi:UDP:flavonoid glycosyltransferase YjiC (YdhE family)
VASDPNIWHPVRGVKLLIRWAILHTIEPIYQYLEELYLPGETVVAAPVTAFGARIAQEKLALPLATLHLQPVVLRSLRESPYLPPMLTGRGIPQWLKRFQFYLADRLLVDPLLASETNRFRARLGLPPVRRLLDVWCHSPQQVIGLFPSWFAPPQADWPPQTQLTGFPLWDERPVSQSSGQLEAFLERGRPPLVFTPGSAMQHGRNFFRVAAEVSLLLKRRAILLTRHAAQIPSQLPEGVVHFDYVPFSQLLPRAAALVHHGGIGSTAQAFAAGIPQLIMAMAFDQPDNARRVTRLGAGAGLSRRQFRTPRVTNLLEQLLSSQEVASCSRALSARLQNARPIDETADLLEQLIGKDR